MDAVRNGRAIIDNNVRDIMLPSNGPFTFDFSRYVRPYFSKDVFCIDAETAIDNSSGFIKNGLLLDRIIGFESYNVNNNNPKQYTLAQKQFDVLSGVNLAYAHPNLEDILSQLNISSLTPFYMADNFYLETTGEKVPMEVMQIINGPPFSRTATFEQPVAINGGLYLLEVKGVNYGDMPVNLGKRMNRAGECGGGLTKNRMQHSVEIVKHLNSKGYDDVILVAAYQIPELKQYNGQELGAYIRAVKCSPSVSHYINNLPDVAEALNMSREGLAEYIIRGAARDLAIIWKAGITHNGPIHEQNIRIGSITDFTASQHVKDFGFKGVVYDATSFVFSCQHIMEKVLANGTKAKQSNGKPHKDQAEHYSMAREIIIDELNHQLGLNLPHMIGTASLGAEIYRMQRQLGLANPDETLNLWYDIVGSIEYDDASGYIYRTGPGIMKKLFQLFGKEPQATTKHLQIEDLLIQ